MAQKNTNQLKRSQLSKTAVELNDVLGLEPGIDPKAKIDELKEKVMEAGGMIDPEADELSEDTWKIMEVLGAAHRPAQEYVPQHEEGTEETTTEKTPEQDTEETAERVGGEQTEEPQEGNVADISASEDTAEAEKGTQENNEQENEEDNKSEPETSGEKAEEPKQQEATSSSNKSGPAGKSKRFADDQVITVLAEKNPKRNGSKCYDRFNLYKNGITVKQYVEAGGKRDDIRWDSERGYIQVQ